MSAVLDVADLAAEQWGLVTTAQARSLGVSPQAVARLAAQGGLERVAHGVYRVNGTPPSSLDVVRAAWLALDPSSRVGDRLRAESPVVVSHRSAAAILGLGDLEADRSEFTSSERKQTRRPDIQIHRGQVGADEWTVVDGLPVTTAIRTVADLAAAHIDGGHLASAVRDALTRHQVDEQLLEETLRKHAHHYGVGIGDGEALLMRLLQESGVSQPIERAVELAAPRGSEALTRRGIESSQLRELNEHLAAIQRAIAPAARMSEQLANSPALKAAAESARQLQVFANSPAAKATADMLVRVQSSPSLQALAAQHAAFISSPTMKALADLTEQLQSPEVLRLAMQYTETAKAARQIMPVSGVANQRKSAVPEMARGDSESE